MNTERIQVVLAENPRYSFDRRHLGAADNCACIVVKLLPLSTPPEVYEPFAPAGQTFVARLRFPQRTKSDFPNDVAPYRVLMREVVNIILVNAKEFEVIAIRRCSQQQSGSFQLLNRSAPFDGWLIVSLVNKHLRQSCGKIGVKLLLLLED